jgi:hypothetical protein
MMGNYHVRFGGQKTNVPDPILDVLSLLSIFCGILVIISKNPKVLWEKLSKSGDTLKLLVPSFNRKVKSG